jgi:CheY-like chemotaxis protein
LEQTLPALLITGDTAPERLREARASGIPLLHKPVSPDQLYRRIESMLHQVSIS